MRRVPGGDDHWLAVVDAFGSAALDSERWPDALFKLARLTGSRSGQLIGVGAGGPLADLNWLADEDPHWVEAFARRGGVDPKINPRIEAGMRAQPLQVITDLDLVSPEERRRHPFYADALPSDVPYICATPLLNEGGSWVGLAVLRSAAQQEIDPRQRSVFQILAPHVRAAVRTQIALENQGATLLAGALGALSMAAFVCDRVGAVRALTPAAEALVAKRGPLALARGRLRVGRAEDSSRLAAAIDFAIAHPSGVPAAPALTTLLIRRDPELPLVLDVVPLPPRPHGFGFEPRALIVARGAERDPERPRQLLQAAYRLTSAEVDIALQLSDGKSADAIAAARGVAVGTVRAQIKAILAKVGAGRQLDLVARINRLR